MRIDIPYESKTLFEIGTSLGRIARFGGAGDLFASVFVHSLCVALLLPGPLRLHGLIHDIPEVWGGEHPKDFKRQVNREIENEILSLFYKEHNLILPTHEEHLRIKIADERSAIAEIHLGAGGPALKDQYPTRDLEAERIISELIAEWGPERLVLTKDAGWKFEELFWQYRDSDNGLIEMDLWAV